MIADRIRSIQAVSGGGGGGGGLPVSGAVLWLDGADSSTIFTDAGVTPVSTTGDLVYQWSDKSGNNSHATQATSGNRPTWLSNAYNQNGIVFNGINQRLAMPLPTLDTGYSIYAVIKSPVAASTGYPTILSMPNAGVAGSTGLLFYNKSQQVMGVSQWGGSLQSSYTVAIGDTVAVAAKYDGVHTSGGFSHTVLGKALPVTKTMTQNVGTPAAGMGSIASDTQPTPSQYADITVYEIILYNRTLTSDEDREIANHLLLKWDRILKTTSLILNMDGTPGSTTFVDSSPNALAVTAVGDAQIVSDATFGTVASFDGSGDYLTIPDSDAFYFSGNFTVEAWVYKSTNSGVEIIFTQRNSGSDYAPVFLFIYNGVLTCSLSSSGTSWLTGANLQFNAGISIPLNTWTHIAVSRSGSTFMLYQAGSLVATYSNTSTLYNSSRNASIGAYATGVNYFNGRIGPTRITEGVARYTANFTPPTGPFPAS